MSTDASPIRACTPAEEGIWFEEQMRAGDSNTGFFSVTMRGPLDASDVRSACEAIVTANPPLRSVVHVDDDRPMIMEKPPGEPLLYELVDVPCGIGEEAAAARTWREAHGKCKWDLTREPPLAFYHLLHDRERSTLLVVVHHMCFDGRSKFIFAREFISALSGRAPQARKGNGAATTEDAATEAAAFWDRLDVPAMPALRLSAAVPTGAPATVASTESFVIDGVAALRALAEAGGTTLFGGILAGVAALLHNYGNEHIVLCIPADTSRPQERDRIGLAVNVVPIYLHMPPGATFATALEAARLALMQVKRFRRVPLRHYWVGRRWAGAARSLFSKVSVAYQRLPLDIPQVPGGRVRTEWDFVAPNTAQTFDLMFQLRDRGEDVLGRIDHRTDRLDATAAHRFTAELRETIRLGMTAPDAPIATYPCPPADSVVEAEPLRPGWLDEHLADADPTVTVVYGLDNATVVAQIRAWAQRRGGKVIVAHEPAEIRSATTLLVPLGKLVDPAMRVHTVLHCADLGIVALRQCTKDKLSGTEPPLVGEVAPGWGMAVMANGRILPRGLPGRLILRRHADGELVDTHHVGMCDPDGGFRWIGAQEDIAVFAGLTTSAARLRRVLLAHPDVADADVRFEEDRYVAMVTPRQPTPPDPMALRAYLRRNAAPDEHRPSRVEVRC